MSEYDSLLFPDDPVEQLSVIEEICHYAAVYELNKKYIDKITARPTKKLDNRMKDGKIKL